MNGEVNADAKETALRGETGSTGGAGGGATEGRSVEAVEDAAVGDATERREATAVGVCDAGEKQALGTTSALEKTSSMLEMLKLKRGMGIFGKSSSVVPTPIVIAAPIVVDGTDVSMPSPAGTTEGKPEPSTQELRVETGDHAGDVAEGAEKDAPDVNGEKAAGGKDKTTAATPSVLNGLPSRFKMSMGMFGSGKPSPSGASRGSTSAPTPAAPSTAAAASAPATAAAAASTPSAAAGASSTSSGGSGKFSSYARRAGNFLGEDWEPHAISTRLL